MTDIKVPTELKEGEILVEMVATGICHTDIALTNPHMGQAFPMVPGHEGTVQHGSDGMVLCADCFYQGLDT